MPESAKSRRWLQLSVRSLLFLTLLIAAYFAGVATMLRCVERAERDAREARDAQQAAQDQAESARLNELRARDDSDLSLLEAARLRELVEREFAELKASQQAETGKGAAEAK